MIILVSSRSNSSRIKLKVYKRILDNFNNLPLTITELGSLIGIRGFKDIYKGPIFSKDVLYIKVSGLLGLYLTIVDLLGLISVANKE